MYCNKEVPRCSWLNSGQNCKFKIQCKLIKSWNCRTLQETAWRNAGVLEKCRFPGEMQVSWRNAANALQCPRDHHTWQVHRSKGRVTPLYSTVTPLDMTQSVFTLWRKLHFPGLCENYLITKGLSPVSNVVVFQQTLGHSWNRVAVSRGWSGPLSVGFNRRVVTLLPAMTSSIWIVFHSSHKSYPIGRSSHN